MKENNIMSYEMYEDFKETMVKVIKSEIAALVPTGQPTDTDLSQRLEQIILYEQDRNRTIITQLAGRLETIERSNAKRKPVLIICKHRLKQSKSRPNCHRASRNI